MKLTYAEGMCGRFVLSNAEILGTRFRIGVIEDFANDAVLDSRYNVAPSQPVVTVLVIEGGTRVLRQMHWGFEPAWRTQATKQPRPINARSETLLERPMWRTALMHGRCIIPADGFYEWMAVPGRKAKQPMHIRLTTGEVFGFAGLHTTTRDGAASCAIITCGPNELMAAIHHRMPCILRREDEERWQDPTETDPAALLALLRPYPTELMEAFPVSGLVSSAQTDEPSMIRPLL